MAYTTTATELFNEQLPKLLKGVDIAVERPVRFEIGGDAGGTWTVDFQEKTVVEGTNAIPVSAIIKAEDIDFMALVEGRMSPSDGLLTERLSLTGTAETLSLLMETLTALEPRPALPA